MCSTTGALEYGRVPGLDVFPSEAAALAHLSSRGSRKHTTRGCAVLGCGVFGDVALVLLARKVRTAVVLPNGHEVLTVVDAKWHRAPLRDPRATLTREERAAVQSLTEIPMENLYFYCETFDVTRPFAHAKDAADDPDREWVWNAALAAPLNELGIPGACPVLLQGLAESRRLVDAEGAEFRVAVFGRRSSAHPGTRYLARGLNDRAAPGNEVEMEQLVWREEREEEEAAVKKEEGEVKEEGKGSSSSEREDRAQSGGGEDASSGPNAVSEARGRSGDEEGTTSGSRSCASGEASSSSSSSSSRRRLGSFSRWSGYVWRRGSVPIRWRQEIKQSIGEAEIVVAKENPYQGTGAYFSRLARAYRPRDSAPETDRGGFPVTCVNLLRCAPGKPELLLSEHFHEAVRGARRRAGLGAVTVLNFDWHGNIKSLGEAKTVEGLWNALGGYLVEAGVSRGRCGATADHGQLGRDRRRRSAKACERWQRGVLRYNCADSLDRTNLASYFAAVQVLVEQCRLLGLDVVDEKARRFGGGGGGDRGGGERGDDAGPIGGGARDQPKGLGLGAAATAAAAATYGRRDAGGEAKAPAALPPGWESRFDTVTGRTFYIDHNTRTTQWTLPAPEKSAEAEVAGAETGGAGVLSDAEEGSFRSDAEEGSSASASARPSAQPWGLLGAGVDDVRASVLPSTLAAMCEIFLANGDLHSAVYTASRAIHTSIFHLLDGSGRGASRGAGGGGPGSAYAAAASLSNLSISAQRRFLNMTQDAHRHQQFEMFLGAKRETHFPSLRRTTKATPATNASEDEEARRVSLARPRSVGASAFAALSRSVGSGSFNGGFASAAFETHREGAAVHASGGANAAFSSSPLHQTRRGSVDLAPYGTSPTERAGGGGGGGGGAGLARTGSVPGSAARLASSSSTSPGGSASGLSGARDSGARAYAAADRVLSRPPGAAVLVAPPSLGAPLAPPEALLGAETHSCASCPLWACPVGVRAATLVIWLARPGAPTRVLLTSPGGAGEHAAPTAFDALAGASLDALAPLAVDVAIPRVAPGTAMAFPMIGVDGDRLQSEVSSESLGGGGGGGGVGGYAPWSSRWRFDDAKTRAETLAEDAATLAGGALAAEEEEEAAARDESGPGPGGDFFAPGRTKARVVCLVFRSDRLPPDACMALGHVEVLGRPSGERGGAGGEPYPFRGDGGGISGGANRDASPGGGDARRRPGGGSPPLARAKTFAAAELSAADATSEKPDDGRENGSAGCRSPPADDPLGAASAREGSDSDSAAESAYVAAAKAAKAAADALGLSTPPLGDPLGLSTALGGPGVWFGSPPGSLPLASLLSLERDRLALGLTAAARDAALRRASLDPDAFDPTPGLFRRESARHAAKFAEAREARRRRAASEDASRRRLTPGGALGGLAALSPWEHISSSVARTVGGLASGGSGAFRDAGGSASNLAGAFEDAAGAIGIGSGGAVKASAGGGAGEKGAAADGGGAPGGDGSGGGEVPRNSAASAGASSGDEGRDLRDASKVVDGDDSSAAAERAREDALLAEVESLARAAKAARRRGGKGASGESVASRRVARPSSPIGARSSPARDRDRAPPPPSPSSDLGASPLRASTPDCPATGAPGALVPTPAKDADEVTLRAAVVSRRRRAARGDGARGVSADDSSAASLPSAAQPSSAHTPSAVASSSSSASFVLPLPARVTRVAMRASADIPAGSVSVALRVGDGVASLEHVASWTLGAVRAGELAMCVFERSSDGRGASRRASAPIARVCELTVASVERREEAPVAEEEPFRVSEPSARPPPPLDVASARVTVKPTFPTSVDENPNGGPNAKNSNDANAGDAGDAGVKSRSAADDLASSMSPPPPPPPPSPLVVALDPPRACATDAAATRPDVVAALDAGAETRAVARIPPGLLREEAHSGGGVIAFDPDPPAGAAMSAGGGFGGGGGGGGAGGAPSSSSASSSSAGAGADATRASAARDSHGVKAEKAASSQKNARGVAGFRLTPPDPTPGHPRAWVVRVGACDEDGGGFQRVGDFVVPESRGRTPLRFDFPAEVAANKRLVFESVALDGEGGGEANDGGEKGERGAAWVGPPPALTGRIQCFRLAS